MSDQLKYRGTRGAAHPTGSHSGRLRGPSRGRFAPGLAFGSQADGTIGSRASLICAIGTG
jgi:hypothetical protein